MTEKAAREYKKVKTDFQHFLPTWEKRKNTRHIFQNMSD